MRKTGSMAHQKKPTFICKKWFGLQWLVMWNLLFNQWTSFLNLPSVSLSNRSEKLTFKQNVWPEFSRSSTQLTILSICFAIWWSLGSSKTTKSVSKPLIIASHSCRLVVQNIIGLASIFFSSSRSSLHLILKTCLSGFQIEFNSYTGCNIWLQERTVTTFGL